MSFLNVEKAERRRLMPARSLLWFVVGNVTIPREKEALVVYALVPGEVFRELTSQRDTVFRSPWETRKVTKNGRCRLPFHEQVLDQLVIAKQRHPGPR